MADTPTTGIETLASKITDALAEILKSSTSPDALQAQQLLLRRLAVEGDVFPSRVPAPRNITEIGGYLNLLQDLDEGDMREQVLASILGVAGPNPTPGFEPSGLVLFDVQRANDRPAGPSQASVPVQFSIRNDFAPPFDAALKAIHDVGCVLPILAGPRALPPAGPGINPPADLLTFLGRTLDLMPSGALNDPDVDPIAVARLDGTPDLEVVARQLDAAAPNAALVLTKKWVAQKCDANACVESKADRKYFQLTPILNSAGWYQKPPATPVKLSQPGTWSRWTNVTGLVKGMTKFGDELNERFTRAQVAASSLRDAREWVWDGQTFARP